MRSPERSVGATPAADPLSAENEAWFRALAMSTSAAIFVFHHRFLFVNEAFERLTGYRLDELLELGDPVEILHPDDQLTLKEIRRQGLGEHPTSQRHEVLLITREGEERWIDSTTTPIEVGGETAILGTAFDITDRKQAEIARAQSEERLGMAQRAAGVATWDWNLLTDELVISEKAAEALGLPASEIPRTTDAFFQRFIHPDDRSRVLAAVRRAIREDEDYAVERRSLSPDGQVRWLTERGRAIRDESGWVVRMVGVSIDITERKEAEIGLQENSERLRLMVEQMPAVLWTTDRQLRFTSSLGSGLSRLGLKANAVVGLHLLEYFNPGGRDTVAYQAHLEALNGESVSFEQVWGGNIYQSHVEPLRNAEGEIVGCVGLALDVTEQRRVEENLERERELAHVTLASIDDGVIRSDAEGRIESMNPVAERLTGVTLEEARGKPLEEICRIVDEVTGKPLMNPVDRVLKENRPVMLPGHRILLARDGSELAIRDSAAPIRDSDGRLIGAVLAFKDITAVHHMEREMAFLANHDGLTGLLSRAAFERCLVQALERVALDEGALSVVQIDIAQFKVVNDTCGHLAGDEVLKGVARRLRAWAGEHHAAARLGVDEFGILLEGCAAEEARKKAEDLRKIFHDFRFSWQDRSFDVRAHFGLVTASARDSAGSLMIAVDIACMLAKEHGRGTLHEYQADDEMLAERYREMHWIHRIYRALEEGSFRLYCQPIQALSEEEEEEGPLGEVLLRMVGEDGELVMPRTFLPAAERYRLISSIDRWVIKKSFEFLSGGATVAGQQLARLAINISGDSLGNEPFLEYVVGELEASGVEPEKILLEITETAAIANLDGAMRFIAELRERGVRFVLDDFGSGLSSFAYLANLPVDYLKIAGEFLRGIESSPMNRTLVRSIHQISQELGLKTIAEGVETAAIFNLLEEIEIDYAQGFWIARPTPLQHLGK